MTENPEDKRNLVLSRRGFLTAIAALAMPVTDVFASVVPEADRKLSFYNTHTGEKLRATFWSNGQYLDDGIAEINWILRDHRAEESIPIDTHLLDLLHRLQSKIEHTGEFHVISGYRSPATNAMLQKHSAGVAKKSYHMQGKAIDVRLPGVDSDRLKRAAITLKGGGVGYYPSSDFVHLDVGRVRYW